MLTEDQVRQLLNELPERGPRSRLDTFRDLIVEMRNRHYSYRDISRSLRSVAASKSATTQSEISSTGIAPSYLGLRRERHRTGVTPASQVRSRLSRRTSARPNSRKPFVIGSPPSSVGRTQQRMPARAFALIPHSR